MTEPIIASEKTVFQAPYFDVKEQEILFPNQKKTSYFTAVRKPVVAILPMLPAYKIYLVSQYRTMLGKRMLEVVAGHVDPGENPLQAAKRELKEETGIEAFQWEQLRTIDMSASVFKTQTHIFMAKDLERLIAEPDEDEEIKLVKLPLQEAVKKVMIGEINTATSMISILLLDRMKREGKI